MNRLFDSDSGLMRVLTKIFDICYLSLVWLLFSLPLITMGAATTALYYTTVKVVRRERGYIFREFWHAFKTNFISATVLWSILLAAYSIIYVNIKIVIDLKTTYSGYMIGIYIGLGIFLLAIGCYIFPVLSRFEMKRMRVLRMSIYMVIRHLPYTIVFVVIIAVTGLGMAASQFIPIIPVVLPASACWLYSFLMEILLKKYTPNQGNDDDDEDDDRKEWYLQ